MIHGRFFLVSFSCQQSLSGYLKQVVVVQWEDSRRHSLRLENLPPDLQVLALHHLSCSIFWLTHRSTSFDILNEYMISVARNCYRFRCGLLTVYVIKTKQKQSLSLFSLISTKSGSSFSLTQISFNMSVSKTCNSSSQTWSTWLWISRKINKWMITCNQFMYWRIFSI